MKDYLPDVHYKSLSDLEGSYWWHVTRINFAEKVIRRHFPVTSNLSVLDYGCGTGGFLFELNKRLKFKSCLGVDASKQAIHYAGLHGGFYMHMDPGDFSVVRTRDLVFLMDVLEHIEDDVSFLGNLLLSLETNAYLVISVPAHPFLFSSWDTALNHHRRYSRKGLFDLIDSTGGKIVYMNYFLSYLSLPIFFTRIFLKKRFDKDNCEFPPVHPLLNRVLLELNRIEMIMEPYFRIPFGSTLIALVTKKQELQGCHLGSVVEKRLI
ncbi:MAG: class I SAM-dependent methyltransferase [Deltaproteobacteria bacterium]|nr:class I SAM-dependent methyltransferase [Deltaproteobacteria bacterium]